MSRARSRTGFTLVEVLVAAVVCGAGLVVISSAIATSVRAESHAENLVRATRLLSLLLGRVEGGVLPLQAASGDFTADGAADVTYAITVAPTDPSNTENLAQVTLEADWVEQGTPASLSIVRLIFQDPDAANVPAAGGGG